MTSPTPESLRTLADIVRFEQAAPLEERLPARSVYELFTAAARRPDRPALTLLMTGEDTESPRVLGYHALAAEVTRAANFFAELGGRGVGVAYLLPSLIETQLVLWGAETAGYAVPINFLLQAEHVADLVRASGAHVLVALGPHPQLDIWQKALRVREILPEVQLVAVAPPDQTLPGSALSFAAGIARQPEDRLTFGPARSGDEVAAYFHTGGTTGTPKLVAHSHRSQLTSGFGSGTLYGFRESDVMLNGLPMFHVGGTLACSLHPFLFGAHVILLSPSGLRNPAMVRRFWRIIERHRATVVGAVPTSLGAVCEVPVDGDLSSVRVAFTGAAPTPRAVAERFEAVLGKPLHELLGMTEASGVIAVDPAAGTRTLGSVGYRIPYTEVRVARLGSDGSPGATCTPGEVGVLMVRGPHVSPGYRDPAHQGAMLPDGWLNTGDLVYFDDEGKLRVAGRSKDLIIRGGHNIDPAMIEEAFAAHPAVALAAAVGEPDAYAGEVPVCYVALRPGAVAGEEELRAFAEARIAERPAWPKHIHLVDTLPLTAIGKIYKPALRADAARRVAAAAVSRVLGHEAASVEATPGGKQGMRVAVTLAAADGGQEDAVRAALAGYLFESLVSVAPGGTL